MTGSNPQRGFALLVAIVLSTVALSITLALTSLAFKSLLLASSARESQYAFYAADSALECALYFDSHSQNRFIYSTGQAAGIVCGGISTYGGSGNIPGVTSSGTTKFESSWFTVNGSDCARITVYKESSGATTLFGTGVNVACSDLENPRAVERGLRATY